MSLLNSLRFILNSFCLKNMCEDSFLIIFLWVLIAENNTFFRFYNKKKSLRHNF